MMSEEAKLRMREKDRLRRQLQRYFSHTNHVITTQLSRQAQRGIIFSERNMSSSGGYGMYDILEPAELRRKPANAKARATAFVKDAFRGYKMVIQADIRPTEEVQMTGYEIPVLSDAVELDLGLL